jgi:hypothetical protein
MPKNLSTNFDEFVNENVSKPKRVNKSDVKSAVIECLSSSDKKMNISEIAKATGFKHDNVYVAVVETENIKSKKFGDILYWYINENQTDPHKKINVSTSKKIDEVFLKSWEDDCKNNPSNRKIFLTMKEHREYVQKQVGTPTPRKPRAAKSPKGTVRTRRKK